MYTKKMLLFVVALVLFVFCSCGTQGAKQSVSSTATEAASSSPAVTTPIPDGESTPSAEQSSTTEASTEAPEESTDDIVGDFSLEDLAISIDGKVYKVKDDSSALLTMLGEDYDYSEAISCVFDGYDKVYTYPSIEVCTYPDGEKDIIDQFVLLDDTYETLRGIKVGDSMEDVEAAYGSGYFMDGPYMTYMLSGDEQDIESPRSYFELDDNGIVQAISLHYPTVES